MVFLDALVLKIREGGTVQRRACYLALGVTVEGERDVLGMWFQESEGAKFWMQVLSQLKQRGISDILLCCVARGLRRAVGRSLPGDHAGAAERLGGRDTVPRVSARAASSGLHDKRDRSTQPAAAQNDQDERDTSPTRRPPAS